LKKKAEDSREVGRFGEHASFFGVLCDSVKQIGIAPESSDEKDHLESISIKIQKIKIESIQSSVEPLASPCRF